MKSKRIIIDKLRLIEHAREQYHLITKACSGYDKGDISEAKNIANRIRIFVHNTTISTSLIKLIALTFNKSLYIETAQDKIPPNTIFFLGPVIRISNREVVFVPMFDYRGKEIRKISYKDWWKETLIIAQSKNFTRCDLITTYTNQDGGVHVDPTIDEDYKRLTEGDILKLSSHFKGKIIENDLLHVIVRESAFYLIKALENQYREYL